MDQVFFVSLGTSVTFFYVLSPVKLKDKILTMLEKLGTIDGNSSKTEEEKARSYYVRSVK